MVAAVKELTVSVLASCLQMEASPPTLEAAGVYSMQDLAAVAMASQAAVQASAEPLDPTTHCLPYPLAHPHPLFVPSLGLPFGLCSLYAHPISLASALPSSFRSPLSLHSKLPLRLCRRCRVSFEPIPLYYARSRHQLQGWFPSTSQSCVLSALCTWGR